MHRLQCGLPTKELIACLYAGVDTRSFSEYWPTSTSQKKHFYLDYLSENFCAKYLDTCLYACQRRCLDDQYFIGIIGSEN